MTAALSLLLWASGGSCAAGAAADPAPAARAVNAAVAAVKARASELRQKREEIDAHASSLGDKQLWQLSPEAAARHVQRLRALQEEAAAIRSRLAEAMAEYRLQRADFERQAAAVNALRAAAEAALARIAQADKFHRSNVARASEAIKVDLPRVPALRVACEKTEIPESEGALAELGPLFGTGSAAEAPKVKTDGIDGGDKGLAKGYDRGESLARGFGLNGMKLEAAAKELPAKNAIKVCSADPFAAALAPIQSDAARSNLEALERDLRESGPRKLRKNPWPGVSSEALFGKVAADTAMDLSGRWQGTGYRCETNDIHHILDLVHSGGMVVATKVTGDLCVTVGQVSWRGQFDGLAPTFPVEVTTTLQVGGEQVIAKKEAAVTEENGAEMISIGELKFTRMPEQGN